MKRIDLRKQLMEVFGGARASLTVEECRSEAERALIEIEKQRGWPTPNGGDPWTDEQLAVVLSDAPTRGNCLKHARAFGRSFDSVEQIYRWASTTDEEISRKREGDKFVHQVKSVAKSLGLRGV